jgi:putative transposase
MGSTLTNLVYHVVFSTKEREPMIVQEFRDEVHQYIGGIVKGEGGILLQIGGTSDHIHIVIKLKPIHALSEIMQKVKGSSSKWINEKNRLPGRFAWQDGYGAFTVSQSQLSAVIRYVSGQEKHHSHLSFKDEFVRMLERHGVEYDERYIWT